MNNFYFNDLVKGRYGRRIAYTDYDYVDESNIVKIVGECIGVHNQNKAAIKYLWDYMKGDQPALYRTKTSRDDIINHVVENHAWEIVQFKCGQTYGEPIQIIALTDDKQVNKFVDKFNSYMRAINKSAKDIECGQWQSAVGTGYKAIQMSGDKELPVRLTVPTPMNTFVIYSRITDEALVSVQELKNVDGETYLLCFTTSHEYRIQNSKLLGLGYNNSGEVVFSKLHAFGGIPIVEYPNNPERISDIELVITMLDAINNMQSNRMDAIEQFVQSWVKFINCEIDGKSFEEMKQMGALAVNSTGDKNADVDIISQELKQSEAQVSKDDIWNNVLSISAIPNKQGNASGDTQGAVELRNGWDFSKQRARMKDPFVVEAERKIDRIALNIIRIRGNNDCPLKPLDFDVQINHSPTDNMQVKAQSLQMLLSAGIHPLIALKVVGLFPDSEKTYNLSKPYMDVLYKTIDMVEDAKEQELKAQQLLASQQNKDNKVNEDESK